MDDHFGASDRDRDRAAALLREHFAAGRLTRPELDERVTAMLNAKTSGDLRGILADLPGAAPGGHAAALERGYRRLLVFYPARYRHVHEDEMLAVLMTAAPGGKRRPGIGEATDLLLGALRVRCQPSRDGANPAWRDALAVLSVILPVIILLVSAVQDTQMWLLFETGQLPHVSALGVLRQLAVPLALAALVLLRLRRIAALTAAGMLVWLALLSGSGTLLSGSSDAPGYLALGLVVVALIASPGPRRGLQILTWKHGALVVIATLTLSITTSHRLALVVIAVICAGMALVSSLSRWLLVLLAIPAYAFCFGGPYSFFGEPSSAAFRVATTYLPLGLAMVTLAYLLPLVLLILAVVAARRESLRSSQVPPASSTG
ncbi:MAG: DUF1707 SHOCT-like domain-containing protein [Pseudonocardiaceae bacterium]